MQIRSQQKAALGRSRLAVFEDQMMAHLASRFARAQAMAEEELRRFVREGIDEGRGFGLETRYDLRRYLEHRMAQGDDFASRPWAADPLADSRLTAAAKMDQIDAHVLYSLRGEGP